MKIIYCSYCGIPMIRMTPEEPIPFIQDKYGNWARPKRTGKYYHDKSCLYNAEKMVG
jgi:hypothetical protein